MQSLQCDHAKDRSLRFVFNDAVVSLNLAVDATFGDIARAFGKLAPRQPGNPGAIDVTLADPARSRGYHNRAAFAAPGLREED